MENIDIRVYTEEYREDVINLILSIQRGEFGIPITREDQPDLSSIPEFYQSGKGNFWVALWDGKVVGTVALIDIGNNQGALRKMFVKPEYRGKLYNTAGLLLAELLTWARQQGMSEIYLGTTDKFLAAHRFYEKKGFDLIDKTVLPEAFPVMKVDTRFYRFRL